MFLCFLLMYKIELFDYILSFFCCFFFSVWAMWNWFQRADEILQQSKRAPYGVVPSRWQFRRHHRQTGPQELVIGCGWIKRVQFGIQKCQHLSASQIQSHGLSTGHQTVWSSTLADTSVQVCLFSKSYLRKFGQSLVSTRQQIYLLSSIN